MTVGFELNRVVGAMSIGFGAHCPTGRPTGGWGLNAPKRGAEPGIGGWKKTRPWVGGARTGDFMGDNGAWVNTRPGFCWLARI